jgi:Ser/Thr protein kinase RdoA (MazF antagonist)
MAAAFADLTPDAVLNTIDATGLYTSGTLLALNSYENRVFQVGIEDGAQPFVVAKFYRPGRWSDAQILEEHAFTLELAAAEVPAVPPLVRNGRTLHAHAGYRFALYPRRGGRAPELESRDVRCWLGRFIGRIHAVGARSRYAQRPALDVQTFGEEPLAYLADSGWVPHDSRDVFFGVAAQADRKRHV